MSEYITDMTADYYYCSTSLFYKVKIIKSVSVALTVKQPRLPWLFNMNV